MESSGPRMLLRAMSGPITASIWIDIRGSYIKVPLACPGSDQPLESSFKSEGQGACRTEWPALPLSVMVVSGPELQLRALPGSVTLLQPWSVLTSYAPVTIKGHPDTRDLGPFCYLGATPPVGAVVTSGSSHC